MLQPLAFLYAFYRRRCFINPQVMGGVRVDSDVSLRRLDDSLGSSHVLAGAGGAGALDR